MELAAIVTESFKCGNIGYVDVVNGKTVDSKISHMLSS